MGVVIPFRPKSNRSENQKQASSGENTVPDAGADPRKRTRRSTAEILRDYAHAMIAFRSVFIEDERFDSCCFWPRHVRRAIPPSLCLSDSQERKMACNLTAIFNHAYRFAKLEAICEAWKLYEEDEPPPSVEALIATFRLVGVRSERDIERLIAASKERRGLGPEAR